MHDYFMAGFADELTKEAGVGKVVAKGLGSVAKDGALCGPKYGCGKGKHGTGCGLSKKAGDIIRKVAQWGSTATKIQTSGSVPSKPYNIGSDKKLPSPKGEGPAIFGKRPSSSGAPGAFKSQGAAMAARPVKTKGSVAQSRQNKPGLATPSSIRRSPSAYGRTI